MRLSISVVLLLAFSLGCPQVAKAQDLVILHTNDTHSQLEEIRTGQGRGMGGVHRRAAYFDQVISQYGRDRVLLLDAGDYNQGTPYFTVFKGDIEMQMMNALGYEVVAIGNHEFDNGMEEFARRLSSARFQTVCANYDFTGTPLEAYIRPYVIVEKAGKKIGIIGLLANIKSLVAEQNRQGLVYMDPYEVTAKWAAYLKEDCDCDLVIVLSHLGYSGYPNQKTDVGLAKVSEHVDLIVGGHSHTYLKSAKVYPNAEGEDVVIVQAGAQGEYVGRFDIDF